MQTVWYYCGLAPSTAVDASLRMQCQMADKCIRSWRRFTSTIAEQCIQLTLPVIKWLFQFPLDDKILSRNKCRWQLWVYFNALNMWRYEYIQILSINSIWKWTSRHLLVGEIATEEVNNRSKIKPEMFLFLCTFISHSCIICILPEH